MEWFLKRTSSTLCHTTKEASMGASTRCEILYKEDKEQWSTMKVDHNEKHTDPRIHEQMENEQMNSKPPCTNTYTFILF
jgi:hypothetical protein